MTELMGTVRDILYPGISTADRREGIVHGMSDVEYHGGPELSSTGARLILDSPARYHYNLTHPQPHKDAYSLGTAVHTRVLGVGSGVITYPEDHLTPSGNPSTKAATVAWADEQRANGFTVIGAAQAALVDGMAEAVLAHPDARGILETIGGREVSLFTRIDDVPMRARFDIYDGVNAADLKTGRDASENGFNSAVRRLGYHIQDRWYTEAHQQITGTELESFKFIAVETFAPFLVAVWDLDLLWQEDAKKKTAKARDLYRRCTEANSWPGYPGGTLTAPTWAVWDDEEQEIQI